MNQDMILRRMEIIDELQLELNKLKSHYDESLENNAEVQKIEEEQEEVKKQQSAAKEKKERILELPSYRAISDQIKEKKQEMRDHKEALAQELIEYYRESGTLEIEGPDGSVKRMKFSVKLVS
jgi:predicted house-cleaning NTP pyrophosphatase (Maf/HAM1 superfamily)